MKLDFSRQFFEKYSSIKFYDRTKLIVAFRNFANAHKNWSQKKFDVHSTLTEWTVTVSQNSFLIGSHSVVGTSFNYDYDVSRELTLIRSGCKWKTGGGWELLSRRGLLNGWEEGVYWILLVENRDKSCENGDVPSCYIKCEKCTDYSWGTVSFSKRSNELINQPKI
jgi:hypothetical protein